MIEAVVSQAFAQIGVGEAFNLEVIVADGASTDGTRSLVDKLAESCPGLKVIDNPEMIVSTGLNRAIRAASGDIIVRFDAHSEYAPDYVLECVRTLTTVDAANVGGPARTRTQSWFQRAVSLAYHSWFSVGGARFHDPDFEGYVDTVTYGCWRRSTLLELGLFDEDLVRNQDDEHNYRLVLQGLKIWQSPKIRSWYYPRSSIRTLFKQYFQYGYWKVFVVRKHGMPASWRHLVPAAAVILGACLAIAALFSKKAAVLLIAFVVAYGVLSIGASLFACRKRSDLILLPVMPIVFATYHASYGIGFLAGIVDALVGKRGGRAAMTRLSR